MNTTQFQNIIAQKDFLEEIEILQIKKIQEQYPYFQIPHFLLARHEFWSDATSIPSNLGAAAINSPNRVYLKEIIEEPKNIGPKEKETIPETSNDTTTIQEIQLLEKKRAEKNIEEESIKTIAKASRKKKPAEDIIESIRKKEKKVIQDSRMKEQIDLIKAFSKKEIKLATIKEIEDNQNPKNLAASSTTFHDKLISESYAKLLLAQGKKKPAQEIYKKLILKFPDKRAYFEERIEKLKD